MGYYFDLNSFSVDEFKNRLLTETLLPSQKILLTEINENFSKIKSYNIITAGEISSALKTKKKIKDFSDLSGIDLEYLTVLNRLIKSYNPAPRKLSDYSLISDVAIQKLAGLNIKNTLQLYDEIYTEECRAKFAKKVGLKSDEVLLLTRLVDVSRLRYVSSTFASMLVSTRFDTVFKIKNADSNELYLELKRVNQNNEFFRGTIGISDIKFLIDDFAYSKDAVKY